MLTVGARSLKLRDLPTEELAGERGAGHFLPRTGGAVHGLEQLDHRTAGHLCRIDRHPDRYRLREGLPCGAN